MAKLKEASEAGIDAENIGHIKTRIQKAHEEVEEYQSLMKQAEAAAAAKLEKQEEKERLRAKLEAKRAELELVTPRNQSLYLATQLTVI